MEEAPEGFLEEVAQEMSIEKVTITKENTMNKDRKGRQKEYGLSGWPVLAPLLAIQEFPDVRPLVACTWPEWGRPKYKPPCTQQRWVPTWWI